MDREFELGLMQDGAGIRKMAHPAIAWKQYKDGSWHEVAWADGGRGFHLVDGKRVDIGPIGSRTWTTNWYPVPMPQNATVTNASEDIPTERVRCPDCGTEDVVLPKDLYKERTFANLSCGCRFSESRLCKALKRHVL